MLVIVRGASQKVDHVYKQLIQDDKTNHYGMIEITNEKTRKLSIPLDGSFEIQY